MGSVHTTSLWDCFSRIPIHRAQIPKQTIMSLPSPGTLFRRCRLYMCYCFSYHKTHKPSLRNSVCSPDPTPEIWIQNESRRVPGTCSHKQASSGACSSDRIQRGGSPQPHLPHPECPVFPLKPCFHHLLGGQLLSPGHCSSGRCALSWNHPVRSPERTFPIPEKLASS